MDCFKYPFIRFGELRHLCAPIGFISLRTDTMPTCANWFDNIGKVPTFFDDKWVSSLGCIAMEFVVDEEQLFLPCMEFFLSDAPGQNERNM